MKKLPKAAIAASLTLTLALGGCGSVFPAYAATPVVVTPKVITTPKANPATKANPSKSTPGYGYGKHNGWRANGYDKGKFCRNMCGQYGFAESCRRINNCPRIGTLNQSNPQMFSSTSGCIWYPWWLVVDNDEEKKNEDAK